MGDYGRAVVNAGHIPPADSGFFHTRKILSHRCGLSQGYCYCFDTNSSFNPWKSASNHPKPVANSSCLFGNKLSKQCACKCNRDHKRQSDSPFYCPMGCDCLTKVKFLVHYCVERNVEHLYLYLK